MSGHYRKSISLRVGRPEGYDYAEDLFAEILRLPIGAGYGNRALLTGSNRLYGELRSSGCETLGSGLLGTPRTDCLINFRIKCLAISSTFETA